VERTMYISYFHDAELHQGDAVIVLLCGKSMICAEIVA
jgi:hypothetical protein